MRCLSTPYLSDYLFNRSVKILSLFLRKEWPRIYSFYVQTNASRRMLWILIAWGVRARVYVIETKPLFLESEFWYFIFKFEYFAELALDVSGEVDTIEGRLMVGEHFFQDYLLRTQLEGVTFYDFHNWIGNIIRRTIAILNALIFLLIMRSRCFKQ